MTDPNGTSVALQYVREELNALGQRMHTELAALRGEVGQLAGEMRAHMTEQGPRMAVLEQRVGENEKDIVEERAARERDMAAIRDAKKTSWQVWLAIALAVLSPFVSWLLTLAGKG